MDPRLFFTKVLHTAGRDSMDVAGLLIAVVRAEDWFEKARLEATASFACRSRAGRTIDAMASCDRFVHEPDRRLEVDGLIRNHRKCMMVIAEDGHADSLIGDEGLVTKTACV